MKLTVIILIFIILTSSGAFAMTFKEGIKVNGGGICPRHRPTPETLAMRLMATENRAISRDVDIQSDSSNLKSKYIYLKKASSLKTGVLNHYKVSATSPIGSQHDISIDHASINSSAEIQRQGNSITTNYE